MSDTEYKWQCVGCDRKWTHLIPELRIPCACGADQVKRICGSMRRFILNHQEDVTGVSGTGEVAEGVEFTDGTVVVRWRGTHATTTVHASFASVEAIHLHAGRTTVNWLEPGVAPNAE
jgi:hypothetical protein